MNTLLRNLLYSNITTHVLDMLPGAALAAVLFACLRPWRKHRLAARGLRSTPPREAALLLFWLFCGGMAVITLTPRWLGFGSALRYGLPPAVTVFGTDGGASLFSPGEINLIPFQTFGQIRYVWLGNIVMFLPFGLFPALLFRGFGWRRALVAGGCITLLIETCQLFIGRTFDVDDLMLNTLGVFCGFLLGGAVRRLFPRFAAGFAVRTALQEGGRNRDRQNDLS